MIYDVIIGKTLPTKYNYNYIKNIYSNRIDVEEITTYLDLVGLIKTSLKEAFQNIEVVEDSVDTILSEFAILYDNLSKNDNFIGAEQSIRELLSALAFSGYDMYIIKREDLKTDANFDESKTRAYMIDKHDSYFPELNRITTGTSLVFNDTADANISTVIMQFIKDIRFNESTVDDIVGINKFVEKYEALEEAHMGYSMNSDSLVEFLDDYGYKFIVVVNIG